MMKRDSIEATRCVLTLALLLASSVAAAHGNPPAGGLVVIDPTDPSTIWLRTNFGIIHIRTDGERMLVFTHSGKAGMNEAYRLNVDKQHRVKLAKTIKKR